MNIKMPESLAPNGDAAALQTASSHLEAIAGKSVARASGEWEVVNDQHGKRQYVLKLSNFAGQVSDRFAPAELSPSRDLRWRLSHLWDDMLRLTIHRLLEKLSEGTPES